LKICFFGWKRAFDYYQIGGTESYVRRLASGLVELGHEVTYAMYGASKRETVLPEDFNATLVYEQRFEDALRQLEGRDFELVVSIYLHPKYRPGFFLFRKRMKRRTLFSTILFSPFRSKTKLILGSMDLHSYDSVFAVSDRIHEQIARIGVKSIVLPPPVSDVYFEATEKRTPDPEGLIRVGYIGRADYGKGFDIAVNIMRSLDKTKYSPSIMTYSWPEKDFEIRPEDFHGWGINLEITRYETYSGKIEKSVANFLKVNDIMLFPFRTLYTTIDVPLSVVEAAVAGCKIATVCSELEHTITKCSEENSNWNQAENELLSLGQKIHPNLSFLTTEFVNGENVKSIHGAKKIEFIAKLQNHALIEKYKR